MEYTTFIIGTSLFGGGFLLLLLFLYLKRKLLIPFILMGVGVVLCFIGLILAQDFSQTP
ncbi:MULTISPECIES: hypothetical protein [Geomicrobium]|uniref:VIT1/CCC1 family predicted Fe2+/Mn2+ transporter n=1 Tax=Geomicrobium sediminis TaxID=1347788 RepID=A0ABS2PDT8_9BACL|nr:MULTISPECIES: hypothetical protein [Geomicrobium]MBM7633563.1 VIT1/CCC1 family predicted Fe2+/Mn2+ transporter [Geomicrobium sediminis]GAK06618.1 hypothetical protein JCM19038_321 [Geomicrobium sp. JCM 19038]